MNRQFEEFIVTKSEIKGLSENTIKSYKCHIEEFINFVTLKCKGTIDKKNACKYILYLSRNRGNSPATINAKVTAVNEFIKFCIKRKTIEENPFEDIELPKIPHREPKSLDDEEVERLLKVAKKDNQRNFIITILFLYTGLRKAELINLKMSDVDVKNKKIIVIGKGNKERTIFINETIINLLKEYCENSRAKMTYKNSEYLFISNKTPQISSKRVGEVLNSLYKQANINTQGCHILRKTNATKLYRGGTDIVTIQRVLGHSNIHTTEIYIAIADSQKQQAAESLKF